MLKRIAGWSVLVLALGGLCLFVFSGRKSSEQYFRTSTGSKITLVGVVYGTNQLVVWGKPYQRLIYRFLPMKFKGLSGVSMHTYVPYRDDVPVFWFHETASKSAAPVTSRLLDGGVPFRVLDEFGCEFEQNGSSRGGQTLENGDSISYMQIDAYDPHGKIIGLCFYDSDAKTQQLARILIPGSVMQQITATKPPLWGAVHDGDLVFQLVSLYTGLKSDPIRYANSTNSILFSEASFRVTKNDKLAYNWFPRGMRITDANGKQKRFWFGGRVSRDGTVVFNFEGVLKPADGPFKLRVEFIHETGFTPDELVTLKDVPFPSGPESLSPAMQIKAQGCTVDLEKVYGSYAARPTNDFQPSQPFLQARITPATNSMNLQLIRGVDETGTGMWPAGMSELGSGRYQFSFGPFTHAKSMTLTFAVHQSRFAEFEAMPVVVSTNAEKK
jgi:hypothetical protein